MSEPLVQEYARLCETWRGLSERRRASLIDGFALDYAYNSGRIENDAITFHDTREVFDRGRVVAFTGDVRTLFEIGNLKGSWDWAIEWVHTSLPLENATVLRAHELLAHGTYDERRWSLGERPGAYKLGDYVVGANDVGAAAREVPQLMNELLEEVNDYLGDDDKALTVAAYLHARLVDIHPFADGNGRVARLLANMVLLRAERPPIVIREQDRIAYYGALDAFHEDGDLAPLKSFLMSESLLTWQTLL